MNVDFDCALIELTIEETLQYNTDQACKDRIIRVASDLSDKTQRTVEIYDHNGNVLDTVTNY